MAPPAKPRRGESAEVDPDLRRFTRRDALFGLSAGALITALPSPSGAAERGLRIRGLNLLAIRATERTTWLVVELETNSQGLTGLGECSLGPTRELPQLATALEWARGLSPFEIQQYRQRGLIEIEPGDVYLATAFSAIEQAMWDLVGKAVDAPVYDLAGGALHRHLEAYANINRATRERNPSGFARSAAAAVEDGFRALKAAPFDGYPKGGTEPEIRDHIEQGIASVHAIRDEVGPDVAVLIDCHSFFDYEQSVEVARRLEPAGLDWYEEPVAPTDVDTTRRIRDSIRQPLAGGEFLFGMSGFRPLLEGQAVDVIMPDIKHCGGFDEGRKIAALAQLHEIAVSPHNPSGPVATAASAHLCAGLPHLKRIEFQWGEVAWRPELLLPREHLEAGSLKVPDGAGWGVALNPTLVERHRV